MSEAAIIPVLGAPKPKRAYSTRRTSANAKAAGVGTPQRGGSERAEKIREEIPDEVVTRKSRGERSVDVFDVPSHYKKRGYDYQWWSISVLGQPVDGSAIAEAFEGGWRPVRSADMPSMLAPGDTSSTIDRRGQRLFARPMHLTVEAKNEDYKAAEQQRRDRIEGAGQGRPAGVEGLAGIKGIRPVNLQLEIEGEAGAYNSSPLQR